MNRNEIIKRIKQNGYDKKFAITLIADFLVTTRERAKKIYEEVFGNV